MLFSEVPCFFLFFFFFVGYLYLKNIQKTVLFDERFVFGQLLVDMLCFG